jgi:hypothetical protein
MRLSANVENRNIFRGQIGSKKSKYEGVAVDLWSMELSSGGKTPLNPFSAHDACSSELICGVDEL